MNHIISKRNSLLVNSVIKHLKERNIEAFFVQTINEAQTMLCSMVSPGDIITWGGSSTLKEIGISHIFSNIPNVTIIDRAKASSQHEKDYMMHQAFLADIYLSSVNAISEDGIIVNIDGIGNRVAAISYGPKKVILVAGVNKISGTLEDAISRARKNAAPINAQRFDINTPCKTTGLCHNCKTESICNTISLIRGSFDPNRIKLIFINDYLGY